MRILLKVLPLLALVALAQDRPSATTFLYAPSLEVNPATVLLSPGYTTLLELFAPVEEQFLGNANLVELKASGNLAVLFPKAKSGETDLILRAKGYTMLFRVRVVEQGGPRRYVIRAEQPDLPEPGPAGPRTSPASTTLVDRGLAVSASSELTADGLKVNLEVRSATIYPVSVPVSQAEATTREGKPIPFRVVGRDAVLMPLKGVTLQFLVPGQKEATLSIPLKVGNEELRLKVVGRAGSLTLALEGRQP
ncbi:hypothetical protein HRbin39_00035 [bacterium HR39]|nr:hypothetical protein HRbin39_00035 [bacterium HR39]